MRSHLCALACVGVIAAATPAAADVAKSASDLTAKSASDLTTALCTGKLRDRAQVKATLAARGETAARALAGVLRSDDAECWERASDVLIAMGPGGAVVVPDLLGMLRAWRAVENVQAPDPRQAAAMHRGTYAAIAGAAVDRNGSTFAAEFADMLERGAPASKALAARLLAQHKTDDAASRIARLLDDPSQMVREEAAVALSGMGPAADVAVPALARAAARDRKAYLAQVSMRALDNIGTPQAEEAIRRLHASN